MKVIVTGATGFVGSRLAAYLGDRGYDVVCPSHGEMDLRSDESCRRTVLEAGADALVHLAALSSTLYCEEHPDESREVNVEGPVRLARACREAGTVMIYASSDQVYLGRPAGGFGFADGGAVDGAAGGFGYADGGAVDGAAGGAAGGGPTEGWSPLQSEDLELSPGNVYGRDKLLCEQRVQEVLPSAIGLRFSWMYDLPDGWAGGSYGLVRRSGDRPHFAKNGGILVNLKAARDEGRKVKANPGEFRGLTNVWEVVRNIELILRRMAGEGPSPLLGGIYNFGHPDAKNTYENYCALAAGMGYDPAELIEADPTLRPRNLAMDISKLRAQGLDFPDVSPRIAEVLGFLERARLPYRIHFHPPLFTVQDALAYWKDIDATHCKNLFFRNHKGDRHYLVSLECHKDLDIHALEGMLRQGKLSFASPERLLRCLGVAPGSIGALSLIHDIPIGDGGTDGTGGGTDGGNALAEGAVTAAGIGSGEGRAAVSGVDEKEFFANGHRVKYFIDSELLAAPKISFHPGDNTASVVLANRDFLRFLELWGGEVEALEIV